MKTISKVCMALAGVAGLALSAESAHAQLVLNGTGSSAGRNFAAESPAAICAASPVPLLFVSPNGNLSEWQCTINSVANSRVRYSATNSSDGYEKQPNGAIGVATFLNVGGAPGCPAGTNVVILGKTVSKSTCPSNQATQSLTVHWGGADVKAASLHQNAGGINQTPPADGHLTTAPTVIVPFAIVVGGQVRNGSGGTLVGLTHNEIRQIFSGNVLNWSDLGYSSLGSDTITVCQRQGGSGTLATLDETIMLPKYWGISGFPGTPNPGSSDMINCLNGSGSSVGYLDSDSVTAAKLTGGGYQVQIDGHPVNAGALGTGVARLTDLRCGRYPYWSDWNFVTRTAGVQGAPINAAAGTNTAIANLGAAMLANIPSTLTDYWLSENDTFVFKNDDRGPHNWFTPSGNGAAIGTVCH